MVESMRVAPTELMLRLNVRRISIALFCANGIACGSDPVTPHNQDSALFTQLVVGGETACGVASDSYVYCWGDNRWGIIPHFPANTAPVSTPTRVEQLGAARSVAISREGAVACALLLDGTVSCWGFYPHKSTDFPAAVSGISNATAVAVGGFATLGEFECVVIDDGSARCWDYDGREDSGGGTASGQLGNGDLTPGLASYPPRPVVAAVKGPISFANVALGERHACGLDKSGAAYCWGANKANQLGTSAILEGCSTRTGSRTFETWFCASRPVPVDGNVSYRAIAAGTNSTCGIASTGTVYCWGGTLSKLPAPVFNGQTLRDISLAHNDRICAVKSDGTVTCTGANVFGEGGDTNPGNGTHVLPSDLKFASVAAADTFTCGLTIAGDAYCWGSNSKGQLGTTAAVSICADGVPCTATPRKVELRL